MHIGAKKKQANSVLSVLGGLAAASAVLVSADGAMAQDADREAAQPTLNDKYEDVFFTFDQTFYQNRRFPRNSFWIFGSFPENEIAGDGRVIHRLYIETLRQQLTSDPTLRTADLPTPFSSSLQADPIYTEAAVPPAPFAPSFRQPATAAPAEQLEPVRQAPVPALW